MATAARSPSMARKRLFAQHHNTVILSEAKDLTLNLVARVPLERPMLPLTPSYLIQTAHAFEGFGEDEFERGKMVWRFLREVNLPHDAPWHTAFVHYAGYWS